MSKTLCAILLSVSAVSTGLAATAEGEYAIRGAGLIDCATYVAERRKSSDAYQMIGGWIDGYITGLNQAAPDTYDIASYESTELYAEILYNHCEKNPDHRLQPVLRSMLAARWTDRLTAKSEMVNIALGDQSLIIYRETISRMQARLRDLGYLEAEPNGAFTPETILAVSEFQKTLDGYEVTGFPDQATLFRLFATTGAE